MNNTHRLAHVFGASFGVLYIITTHNITHSYIWLIIASNLTMNELFGKYLRVVSDYIPILEATNTYVDFSVYSCVCVDITTANGLNRRARAVIQLWSNHCII